MSLVTVFILTLNEEKQIERAMRSVYPIAREVIVVDSYSSDRTVELAKELGAKVFQNKFINQSRQYQWALANIPIAADWVLRLDADEYLEPELIREIIERLPNLSANVTGVHLKYKQIFMGRWIRHGGIYPLILLRLWRRGCARVEDRWMDEHIVLTEGQSITFAGHFCGESLKDLSFFIDKHNRYATREAIQILNQKLDLFQRDNTLTVKVSSRQVVLKRRIKERLYNRTPFILSSTIYFIYRYFLRLGFLDGVEGAIYHFMQGYWYRFLIGAKVIEYERTLNGLDGKAAKIAALSQLTGHDVAAPRDPA
jgi:glycosyltransferase involved in cell wall biosynthesis